jgi:hypothetical protein
MFCKTTALIPDQKKKKTEKERKTQNRYQKQKNNAKIQEKK